MLKKIHNILLIPKVFTLPLKSSKELVELCVERRRGQEIVNTNNLSTEFIFLQFNVRCRLSFYFSHNYLTYLTTPNRHSDTSLMFTFITWNICLDAYAELKFYTFQI